MFAGVAYPQGVTRRRVALRELVSKASAGDAKAMYDLGMLQERGYDTIPADSSKSVALLMMSARMGYPPAQRQIGFLYFNGKGVRADVDSALYWTEKAAAAGDAGAANNLGFLRLHGKYVERDYGEALKWLEKAADAGSPTGRSMLADMYREGLGVEPDTVRAVFLYTKSLESGLKDAGVKLLNMMGRRWEALSVDSMLSLGRYYYTHNAPVIGVDLFAKAAARGDSDAMALLGDAYSRAKGVEYDHDRSMEYFLEAALSGQPSAQFFIAELLDIFPDALRRAEMMEIISRFYSREKVPDDIHSAVYWYDKAAAGGVTDSRSASRRLVPRIE